MYVFHQSLNHFSNFPALTELKVHCNSMSKLPCDTPSNYDFPSLVKLYLSHNLLTNPFHYLHHLSALEMLDVSFNKIKNFPRPSVMSSFEALKSPDTSSNYLEKAAETFFFCFISLSNVKSFNFNG